MCLRMILEVACSDNSVQMTIRLQDAQRSFVVQSNAAATCGNGAHAVCRELRFDQRAFQGFGLLDDCSGIQFAAQVRREKLIDDGALFGSAFCVLHVFP